MERKLEQMGRQELLDEIGRLRADLRRLEALLGKIVGAGSDWSGLTDDERRDVRTIAEACARRADGEPLLAG